MPIRRKGYHHWDGKLRSSRWAWLAILGNGLRLGLRQKHAALLLWSGLSLAGLVGVFFYFIAVFEKYKLDGISMADEVRFLFWFLRVGHRAPVLDLSKMVVPLWTLVFARVCQFQLLLVLCVQAKFGSDLIAGDLRANALPIYFSKPVTVWTYLLGKWLIVLVFASCVTLLPNLLAYAAGVLMSDTAVLVRLTAGLLAGLVAHSLLVAGISSLVILALSSLTRDRRLVIIAWCALVFLSIAAQEVFDGLRDTAGSGLLGSISLYRGFARLGYWLLGVEDAVVASGYPGLFGRAAGRATLGADVGWSLAVLAALTVGSLFVCIRRIRRFQVAVANA